MGNIRRLKRSMHRASSKVAFVDTHIVVNDCRVFIGHPDAIKASSVAKSFKAMMTETLERARKPNLGDLYRVMVSAHEKLLSEAPCN